MSETGPGRDDDVDEGAGPVVVLAPLLLVDPDADAGRGRL